MPDMNHTGDAWIRCINVAIVELGM